MADEDRPVEKEVIREKDSSSASWVRAIVAIVLLLILLMILF